MSMRDIKKYLDYVNQRKIQQPLLDLDYLAHKVLLELAELPTVCPSFDSEFHFGDVVVKHNNPMPQFIKLGYYVKYDRARIVFPGGQQDYNLKNFSKYYYQVINNPDDLIQLHYKRIVNQLTSKNLIIGSKVKATGLSRGRVLGTIVERYGSSVKVFMRHCFVVRDINNIEPKPLLAAGELEAIVRSVIDKEHKINENIVGQLLCQ